MTWLRSSLWWLRRLLMITKIIVVITKMIDDYEGHCGDYEDDWWLRRALWWLRRWLAITKITVVIRKWLVIAKTAVVLDVTPCSVGGHAVCISRRLHNPDGHLYPTAGHNTSRIASSPANENMCKSPVFAAISVLFIGNEYDMNAEHETVLLWQYIDLHFAFQNSSFCEVK